MRENMVSEEQTEMQQARPATLDELQKEIDSRVTKFVKLQPGEAQVLTFTGRTWIREVSFKNKDGGTTPAKMCDFEIAEQLEDGSNRILSRNIYGTDVPKIVKYLKEGRKELMLSKDSNNRISVASLQKK